ncbi:MAG TPA: hypothetical protein VFC00_12420 [Micromonosporaceae bacterium]|nr:hypothetical protein [Micromonosporaceae bacterium]
MIPLSLDQIAAVTGGIVCGDPTLVVTGPAYLDSRSPHSGGLFVAIVGERVDGHSFAAHAHAVLGSRPTCRPTVVVPDPVVALGRLARHVVAAVARPCWRSPDRMARPPPRTTLRPYCPVRYRHRAIATTSSVSR